jgi:hypothetical protein
MTREQVQELLAERPFVPFKIKLSSGDSLHVRHPENAMLLKSVLYVGYPEEDRAVHCTWHHINSIEKVHSTQETHSNGAGQKE